jgi:hypothetical protein
MRYPTREHATNFQNNRSGEKLPREGSGHSLNIFTAAMSVLGFKRRFLLVALICLLTTIACAQQFVQQGGKLIPNQVTGLPAAGFAVAISADGATAVIGGPGDTGGLTNGGVGAVWVFVRPGGTWLQQSGKLVGSGAVGRSEQGFAVALSADGNTAVVGGFNDNGGTGAVWVFTRSEGAWSQQGNKLVGSGATGAAMQGASVAVSGDGNTIIEGGWGDNGGIGTAWVFTRSGNVWTQQGTKLVGTGAVGTAHQGWSAALSSSGDTALVGGDYDIPSACGVYTCGVGAAWVYTRSGGTWTQQGSKLTASDETGSAYFGSSAALSADGNTALIGGPCDNGGCPPGVGAAWVFTRSGSAWTQQGAKLVATDENGTASFGADIALSADGNLPVVGGDFDGGNTGAAWVYIRTGGTWSQLGSKLIGAGAAGLAMQAASVAVSGDGNTIIFGGPGDNGTFPNSIGATWVFSATPGTTAPTAGTSAAASITSNSATLTGSVYTFGLDTKVWFLYSNSSSMSDALSTSSLDVG